MVRRSRSVTVLPSGELAPSATPAPTPTATPDPTGRIPGIDGMLDQVAAAVARQAAPLVRTEILPVLQADRELQRTVGAAAGQAAATKLWPWFAVGAAALVVIAAASVHRSIRESEGRGPSEPRDR